MTENKRNMKKAALWYANHDLPVFPVKPRSKEPLTPHGFKDATTDPAQIEKWYRQWPVANIGLPTGTPSGLLVLDVDPRNGGQESLDGFIAEHGQFPDTAEQQTGGGGRHIVFSHPGGPVSKTLAPGIDLKGDGGYIVVAPSIHPTGSAYQWDGIAGEEALLNPAEVPTWLLERIHAACNGERAKPTEGSEKWGEGERNNRLTSVAGTIRRRGLSQEAIAAALVAENQIRCDPPLPESEVRRIAQSVASYDPADEGQLGDTAGKSQATILIELACGEGVELFHVPSGEAYAAVPVKEHSENWPIKSGGFGRWLRWRFYQLTEKGPSAQAFQDAVNTIVAKAVYEGPEHPVFVRVAEMDGSIYLDLANDAWQAVKIDAQGWQVVDSPPVRFVRRRAMLPLPLPERGSDLQVLRQFVNVGSDSDWILLLELSGCSTRRSRAISCISPPRRAGRREKQHSARFTCNH